MMRSTTLLLSCLWLTFAGYSQSKNSNNDKLYIGVGTGINSPVGLLGPTLEYKVSQNFGIHTGIGIGSWGYKFSFGGRAYLNHPANWAINASYSRASGLDDVEFQMDGNLVAGQSGTQSVPFKLLPANNLNLSVMRFWPLGRAGRNRFHLEGGYSVPLNYDAYETPATLTSQGQAFMKLLQPGGLIIAVGFTFAL